MRLLKYFYQTVFYISGTFTYFLDCTNKSCSCLWDLCNNRIIIINTNFFIFSGKSLMEDKNVYTLPKMGSQNPDLLWNSICERRKVPVMCLQIWGSPLSSSRIKIGPDIQTCYKVVSGGRAYSTLSFHDNVDTGSLWKQANSSTKVFYFQSCHYNHLYNKGFWANWGTIKNYGKNIKPP